MFRMLISTEPDHASYESLERHLSAMTGDEKHTSAATSTLDVLWVVYDRILDVHPEDPDDPFRDRFLLSKGHGPMAYYAVLAAKGFIPVSWLDGYGRFDSPLGHHPDRLLIPGVEISSGSLGHGLPIAVGMALGLRAADIGSRVVVMLGDAELDEGSNHEAIALAGRLGLDRLTAVVIDNHSSTLGWPGGIGARFAVEGWAAIACDGRDHDDIARAFERADRSGPAVVVAEVAS